MDICFKYAKEHLYRRYFDHRLQPDPPTPGPDGKQVKFTENENDAPKRSKSEQDSFMQLRDQVLHFQCMPRLQSILALHEHVGRSTASEQRESGRY